MHFLVTKHEALLMWSILCVYGVDDLHEWWTCGREFSAVVDEDGKETNHSWPVLFTGRMAEVW